MNDPLIAFEEQKRDACWDPVERWKVLQQVISWIDSQQPIPRNSPRGCLQHQQEHLRAAQYARENAR
jgi:hypothetical protein